uniref:Glycine-rich domain-containing protein n=1 Tax=viral metagenome TaxID=1070528 RepID=A0A6C0HBX0_9ZZZZ
MSNYSYKGISLSTLVKYFNNTVVNSGSNFLNNGSANTFTVNVSYSEEFTNLTNVNSFNGNLGHSIKNTDISTYAVPAYDTYGSGSYSLTIPSWCTKIRMILVGGGGGGYGGSTTYHQVQHVHQNSTIQISNNHNNDDVRCTLGWGGMGGASGSFVYFNNYPVTGGNSLQIQVGGGGGGGTTFNPTSGPGFLLQGTSKSFQAIQGSAVSFTTYGPSQGQDTNVTYAGTTIVSAKGGGSGGQSTQAAAAYGNQVSYVQAYGTNVVSTTGYVASTNQNYSAQTQVQGQQVDLQNFQGYFSYGIQSPIVSYSQQYTNYGRGGNGASAGIFTTGGQGYSYGFVFYGQGGQGGNQGLARVYYLTS